MHASFKSGTLRSFLFICQKCLNGKAKTYKQSVNESKSSGRHQIKASSWVKSQNLIFLIFSKAVQFYKNAIFDFPIDLLLRPTQNYETYTYIIYYKYLKRKWTNETLSYNISHIQHKIHLSRFISWVSRVFNTLSPWTFVGLSLQQCDRMTTKVIQSIY